MIFHYRQRNIDDLIIDLQINSETIERVTEFNFLGLTLDENLNWNAHIQKVSNEISRTLGVMCRLEISSLCMFYEFSTTPLFFHISNMEF